MSLKNSVPQRQHLKDNFSPRLCDNENPNQLTAFMQSRISYLDLAFLKELAQFHFRLVSALPAPSGDALSVVTPLQTWAFQSSH